VTVRNALCRAKKRLREAGVESAALDAELLLSSILGVPRPALIAHPDHEIDDKAAGRFENALLRRLDGDCVAYITGHKEFRRLSLAVRPGVLVPRPDTETLVEAAGERLRRRAGYPRLRVLDLCAGSGAVGLALWDEHPGLDVTLAELSPDALFAARENAAAARARSGGGGALLCVESDLFAAVSGRFDLITANPPYIPRGELSGLPIEVRREPRLALDGGEDGLDLLRRIIRDAPARLCAAGELLLEAAPQEMDALSRLLRAAGFSSPVRYRDLSGAERVIAAVLISDFCF
jgi:release factor glutamine methyltransferase